MGEGGGRGSLTQTIMTTYKDFNLSDKKEVKTLETGRRLKGSILVTIDSKGHRSILFRHYSNDAQTIETLAQEPVKTTDHGKLYRLNTCWKAIFRFPHGQMTASEMGDSLSEEADIMSDYVVDHATV